MSELTLETSPGDAVVRFSIAKRFHCDPDASSTGVMLSVRGEVKGLAGYVAMERVTGTLGDRSGSFALQHSATMDRNRPTLGVTIVSDSGTSGLAGLSAALAASQLVEDLYELHARKRGAVLSSLGGLTRLMMG